MNWFIRTSTLFQMLHNMVVHVYVGRDSKNSPFLLAFLPYLIGGYLKCKDK